MMAPSRPRRRHCGPSWADLQPELVGLLLRRLPSLADRVRLGAVCRAWRRAARQEPVPPPLPWLTLLDGTFLSIADGKIHRMRVPEDASLYGSAGDWLFLRRPGGELALMNPFSKRVVKLPIDMEANYDEDDDMVSFKLVPLSTDPDRLPPDPLFAAQTLIPGSVSTISIGRRPSSAIALKMHAIIYDVAFFQGKLYVLSNQGLYALKIISSFQGKPGVSSSKAVGDPKLVCLTIADKTDTGEYWSYLVESNGKLLQIRRFLGYQPDEYFTVSFEVYELDLTIDSHQRPCSDCKC